MMNCSSWSHLLVCWTCSVSWPHNSVGKLLEHHRGQRTVIYFSCLGSALEREGSLDLGIIVIAGIDQSQMYLDYCVGLYIYLLALNCLIISNRSLYFASHLFWSSQMLLILTYWRRFWHYHWLCILHPLRCPSKSGSYCGFLAKPGYDFHLEAPCSRTVASVPRDWSQMRTCLAMLQP